MPEGKRRLAAIFAADVAGYSRLMERDEAGTLAALKAHVGELVEPTIAAANHTGRRATIQAQKAPSAKRPR